MPSPRPANAEEANPAQGTASELQFFEIPLAFLYISQFHHLIFLTLFFGCAIRRYAAVLQIINVKISGEESFCRIFAMARR